MEARRRGGRERHAPTTPRSPSHPSPTPPLLLQNANPDASAFAAQLQSQLLAGGSSAPVPLPPAPPPAAAAALAAAQAQARATAQAQAQAAAQAAAARQAAAAVAARAAAPAAAAVAARAAAPAAAAAAPPQQQQQRPGGTGLHLSDLLAWTATRLPAPTHAAVVAHIERWRGGGMRDPAARRQWQKDLVSLVGKDTLVAYHAAVASGDRPSGRPGSGGSGGGGAAAPSSAAAAQASAQAHAAAAAQAAAAAAAQAHAAAAARAQQQAAAPYASHAPPAASAPGAGRGRGKRGRAAGGDDDPGDVLVGTGVDLAEEEALLGARAVGVARARGAPGADDTFLYAAAASDAASTAATTAGLRGAHRTVGPLLSALAEAHVRALAGAALRCARARAQTPHAAPPPPCAPPTMAPAASWSWSAPHARRRAPASARKQRQHSPPAAATATPTAPPAWRPPKLNAPRLRTRGAAAVAALGGGGGQVDAVGGGCRGRGGRAGRGKWRRRAQRWPRRSGHGRLARRGGRPGAGPGLRAVGHAVCAVRVREMRGGRRGVFGVEKQKTQPDLKKKMILASLPRPGASPPALRAHAATRPLRGRARAAAQAPTAAVRVADAGVASNRGTARKVNEDRHALEVRVCMCVV